jgi:hypothetical protein
MCFVPQRHQAEPGPCFALAGAGFPLRSARAKAGKIKLIADEHG